MATIYLLTLIGAIAVIVTVMLEAVIAVSRRPHWEPLKFRTRPDVAFERRSVDLPFVGSERRNAATAPNAAQDEPLRQAA